MKPIRSSRHALRPGLQENRSNHRFATTNFQRVREHSSSSSGRNGTNGHRDVEAATCALIGLRGSGFPKWKRVLDVICILLAAPLWLPLILFIMAAIRITSRGPIFYRQQRVGYRRRVFMLFKFRTMHLNADTRTHQDYFAELMRSNAPMTKLDANGDSRVIPGGRFLRASGLDELPQIFNVLRGEMSLVGPRPCLPNEFERYEESQKLRAEIAPGLTGYWQVNGKNQTTFKEMIAMDMHYMRNMSPWLDLKIMSKTIPVLLAQAKTSFGSRFFGKRRLEFALVPVRPISQNGSNGTHHNGSHR